MIIFTAHSFSRELGLTPPASQCDSLWRHRNKHDLILGHIVSQWGVINSTRLGWGGYELPTLSSHPCVSLFFSWKCTFRDVGTLQKKKKKVWSATLVFLLTDKLLRTHLISAQIPKSWLDCNWMGRTTPPRAVECIADRVERSRPKSPSFLLLLLRKTACV